MYKNIYSRLLIASGIIALNIYSAHAASTSIPDDTPIATVDTPDNWEVNKFDKGITTVSPDGAVFVAIEKLKPDQISSSISEVVQAFAKVSLAIDASSKKISDFEFGELKVHDITYQASTASGPTVFDVAVIPGASGDNLLVLIKLCTDEDEKKYKEAIDGLLGSVKLSK